MPSEKTSIYYTEVCKPCKWLVARLLKDKKGKQFHRSYCTHVALPDKWTLGTYLDDSAEGFRPNWCPIRGDKQAEIEAGTGDPLHMPEMDKDQPLTHLQVIAPADLAKHWPTLEQLAMRLTEADQVSAETVIICDECGAEVPTALRWRTENRAHDVCATCLKRYLSELET